MGLGLDDAVMPVVPELKVAKSKAPPGPGPLLAKIPPGAIWAWRRS